MRTTLIAFALAVALTVGSAVSTADAASSERISSQRSERVTLQRIADARGDTWRCQDARQVHRTRAAQKVSALARSGHAYRGWVLRLWESRARGCETARRAEVAAERAACGRWSSHPNPNVRLGCQLARGYGFHRDFDALYALWNHESGWSTTANNPSSDACGIPQAMNDCAYGYDAAVQIRWGLGYIAGRYGSPSAALAHLRSHNWY